MKSKQVNNFKGGLPGSHGIRRIEIINQSNIIKIIALLGFAMIMLAVNVSAASDESLHSFIPEQGFVPDETTAMTITEAILVPIYGKDAIERQKPFVVSLSGNVWTIRGSLPKSHLGGVFFIQISKQDGRVITLTHGK